MLPTINKIQSIFHLDTISQAWHCGSSLRNFESWRHPLATSPSQLDDNLIQTISIHANIYISPAKCRQTPQRKGGIAGRSTSFLWSGIAVALEKCLSMTCICQFILGVLYNRTFKYMKPNEAKKLLLLVILIILFLMGCLFYKINNEGGGYLVIKHQFYVS